MHGPDIGNLSIYLKTNQSETLVWMVSGDQGNRWRFGQTSLNSTHWSKVSVQFLKKFCNEKAFNLYDFYQHNSLIIEDDWNAWSMMRSDSVAADWWPTESLVLCMNMFSWVPN